MYKRAILFICILYSTSISANNLLVNTQEWPPYQYFNGNKFEGSATRVVECVLKKMKLKYEIRVLPWKRAQEEVKLGKAHAFYSAGITDERNNYAIPTNKIANYRWYWYLKSTSSLNPNLKEFKEKAEVAAKIGTGPENFLIEQKYNIVASPKDVTYLFDMLEANRFDAFLSPFEAATEEIKKRNWNESKFKIFFHSENDLVFYFSKQFVANNKNAVKKFNSLIKECSK
ncbi:substrate-binding periplasmic protein [Fluviispira vulneris]|uniref:substrate-binding periplasmic protein n=1 Tax=Fluviispira vulneris TaxID=2763012 RepID=UPI0016463235|nr:transporter substrate-binding domain-containing protein [Fluviispira vulneris]